MLVICTGKHLIVLLLVHKNLMAIVIEHWFSLAKNLSKFQTYNKYFFKEQRVKTWRLLTASSVSLTLYEDIASYLSNTRALRCIILKFEHTLSGFQK